MNFTNILLIGHDHFPDEVMVKIIIHGYAGNIYRDI